MNTTVAYDSDTAFGIQKITATVAKSESGVAKPPRKLSREETIRRYDRG